MISINGACMNENDLCRLILTAELANRQVGKAAAVSHNTAKRYRQRLAKTSPRWYDTTQSSEAELDVRSKSSLCALKSRFVELDYARLRAELRRTGVTSCLLYREYVETPPGGRLPETEFRRRYARYERTGHLQTSSQRVSMSSTRPEESTTPKLTTDAVAAMP